MDRLDLTRAALQALQPSHFETAENPIHDEARSIRGRIVGVLIRKLRLMAERTQDECAEYLGTEKQQIASWEFGDSVPCWPQLELLSLFLNGQSTDARDGALNQDGETRQEYLLLRQRLIGALLRAARITIGLSIDELSERTGLDADQMERFELGEEKIPVNDLAALAHALNSDLSYFTSLPVAQPDRLPSSKVREPVAAPNADWRQFAAQSENRAFISLAMAFQQIAPDDLHRIADALFAIISAKGDSSVRPGSPS